MELTKTVKSGGVERRFRKINAKTESFLLDRKTSDYFGGLGIPIQGRWRKPASKKRR